MKKSISVVIPSYNSQNTIEYTLHGLLNQKGDYLKEIIVVDSSDDKGVELIISKYKSKMIRFIKSGVRIMPAISRNIGASHATGDILVFLDSDIIPRDNYLEKIVSAYKKGYRAGGGSVELPDFQNKKIIAVANYYQQLNEYMPVGNDRIKDFPAGCNVFCEKKIFIMAGGYPEIRASEDVLFGFNVNKITPLWFVPDAIVAHIFREEFRGFLSNQILLGRYVAVYRKRESNSIIFKGIMPLLLFPAFYIIKLYRILPRIFKSGFKHFFIFIKVFLIVLIGIFFWTIGFTKGCYSKK